MSVLVYWWQSLRAMGFFNTSPSPTKILGTPPWRLSKLCTKIKCPEQTPQNMKTNSCSRCQELWLGYRFWGRLLNEQGYFASPKHPDSSGPAIGTRALSMWVKGGRVERATPPLRLQECMELHLHSPRTFKTLVIHWEKGEFYLYFVSKSFFFFTILGPECKETAEKYVQSKFKWGRLLACGGVYTARRVAVSNKCKRLPPSLTVSFRYTWPQN